MEVVWEGITHFHEHWATEEAMEGISMHSTAVSPEVLYGMPDVWVAQTKDKEQHSELTELPGAFSRLCSLKWYFVD